MAAFLRTLIPDPNDCQDILQQVAVVAVRKFHEFDRTRSFNAWTIGIAKQEVLALRRRRRTDRLVFSDAMVECIAEAYRCVLADTAFDVADALEICLQKLQGCARTVVGLHYADGLKTIAIAEKLQIEHGAVRMLVFRGHARPPRVHRAATGKKSDQAMNPVDLMQSYFDNDLSEAERQALQRWLEEDPATLSNW